MILARSSPPTDDQRLGVPYRASGGGVGSNLNFQHLYPSPGRCGVRYDSVVTVRVWRIEVPQS